MVTTEPSQQFSPAQIDRIAQLSESGGIKAASVLVQGEFDLNGPEGPDGIQYDLVRGFASFLKIPFEMNAVEFEDFFRVDGIITSNHSGNISANADIFSEYHILAYQITLLAWRTQIMDIVPFMAVKPLLIHQKSLNVSEIQNLNGLRGGIYLSSSYEQLLENFVRGNNLNVEIVPYSFGTDLYEANRRGEIDFHIRDASIYLLERKANPDFSAGMAISGTAWNGWGISREDPVLAELVERYFETIQENGKLDQLFNRYYKISLDEYRHLLGIVR